jgi:hypothetical protein
MMIKDIPNENIDHIIYDYQCGMSLRKVAEKYQTDHHRIKRILTKNNISIRQPKNIRFLRKYENNHVAKYANMKNHLRFNVKLEWLLKFDDFEKLKFLNKQITNKDGNRFQENDKWYIDFIEKFYYDEKFNKLYQNYIIKQDKLFKPSLDHIVPKAKGGTNEINNLRFITFFENMCKKDIPIDEWEKIKNNIGEYFI